MHFRFFFYMHTCTDWFIVVTFFFCYTFHFLRCFVSFGHDLFVMLNVCVFVFYNVVLPVVLPEDTIPGVNFGNMVRSSDLPPSVPALRDLATVQWVAISNATGIRQLGRFQEQLPDDFH